MTDFLPLQVQQVYLSDMLEQIEKKITLPATLGEGDEWYLKAMLHHDLLTKEEEAFLTNLTKEKGERAKRARTLLVMANQRLVYHIARHYQDRGMGLEELLQEGNAGLLNVIRHFDPSRGMRLSTYATTSIRRCIERAIMNQGRAIRVPVHRSRELKTFTATLQSLRQSMQQEPTNEGLAAAMGVSLEQIEIYWSWMSTPQSLNCLLDGEDADRELGDVLSDPSAETEHETVDIVFSEQVRELVGRILNPRQAYVVLARTHQTLEEIAIELHVTRERVRQLEVKAQNKLRDNAEFRALWEAMAS